MAEYILDFVAQKGGALGWRIIFTKDCLDWHKDEYGDRRPYIFDDDFIDNKIKEAIENPSFIHIDAFVDRKTGKEKLKEKVIVFYKEFVNKKYINKDKSGAYKMEYTRIVCGKENKNKILRIKTPLITTKVNKKKICKVIKKIV